MGRDTRTWEDADFGGRRSKARKHEPARYNAGKCGAARRGVGRRKEAWDGTGTRGMPQLKRGAGQESARQRGEMWHGVGRRGMTQDKAAQQP